MGELIYVNFFRRVKLFKQIAERDRPTKKQIESLKNKVKKLSTKVFTEEEVL